MDLGFTDPRLAAAGPADVDDLRPLNWCELRDRLAASAGMRPGRAGAAQGEKARPASFYRMQQYPVATREHGGDVVNPNSSANGKAAAGIRGPDAGTPTATPDEPSFFE